jgi:hypothetical protein
MVVMEPEIVFYPEYLRIESAEPLQQICVIGPELPVQGTDRSRRFPAVNVNHKAEILAGTEFTAPVGMVKGGPVVYRKTHAPAFGQGLCLFEKTNEPFLLFVCKMPPAQFLGSAEKGNIVNPGFSAKIHHHGQGFVFSVTGISGKTQNVAKTHFFPLLNGFPKTWKSPALY